MIARAWTARATPDGAEQYFRFFVEVLVPQLESIEGHRGAQVLAGSDGEEVVITVITFWESMIAVTRFAGAHPELAVVEPEARAVLRQFDREVRHLAVRIDTFQASARATVQRD